MPKLTLSVDERVVRRAKRYAATQGTSVSKLVERGFPDSPVPVVDPAGALTWVLGL